MKYLIVDAVFMHTIRFSLVRLRWVGDISELRFEQANAFTESGRRQSLHLHGEVKTTVSAQFLKVSIDAETLLLQQTYTSESVYCFNKRTRLQAQLSRLHNKSSKGTIVVFGMHMRYNVSSTTCAIISRQVCVPQNTTSFAQYLNFWK